MKTLIHTTRQNPALIAGGALGLIAIIGFVLFVVNAVLFGIHPTTAY